MGEGLESLVGAGRSLQIDIAGTGEPTIIVFINDCFTDSTINSYCKLVHNWDARVE